MEDLLWAKQQGAENEEVGLLPTAVEFIIYGGELEIKPDKQWCCSFAFALAVSLCLGVYMTSSGSFPNHHLSLMTILATCFVSISMLDLSGIVPAYSQPIRIFLFLKVFTCDLQYSQSI